MLAKNGTGYFVGGALTYADFATYPWVKLMLTLPDADPVPKLRAFVAMMDKLPSMQAFDAKGIPLLPASMMP